MNWNRLLCALEYYQLLPQGREFRGIEVPWIVSRIAQDSTRPPGGVDWNVVPSDDDKPAGALVASGEQSFVQMMLDGQLPGNRYVCLTPCWRKEPVYNEFYRPYFMKVELIQLRTPARVMDMVDVAYWFFSTQCDPATIEIVETGDNMFDINVNGIEVGSYGQREWQGFEWTYGTGLAEPRFTAAVKHVR